MKIKIPRGTLVTVLFSRVTIDFSDPSDAERFGDWLRWLNDPENDGKEMQLNHYEETTH